MAGHCDAPARAARGRRSEDRGARGSGSPVGGHENVSDPRYVVGIDLGTTNSALAYVDTQAEAPQIQVMKVPQLVVLGEVGEFELLLLFIYILGLYELLAGSLELFWVKDWGYVVGEFVRNYGSQVGYRLVSSAKS